jgi:hypothetical protein
MTCLACFAFFFARNDALVEVLQCSVNLDRQARLPWTLWLPTLATTGLSHHGHTIQGAAAPQAEVQRLPALPCAEAHVLRLRTGELWLP